MKEYLRISLILSAFGLLKETRPSEPFITDFIVDFKNITVEQINQDIFPIGTYSYLAQLLLVFLVTDFLRYKPLIILLAASGVVIWSLLLWTSSVFSLQIVEVFYGTYQASEIAYFAYIYAKTDKEHYQVVTSHSRAAIMTGRFIAAVLAQFLVYFKVMNYYQLNYLTLIAQVLALCWAFVIPRVETSLYFHRSTEDGEIPETFSKNFTFDAFHLIWIHFKTSYSNRMVVLWSFYYAVSLCFFQLAIAYIQVLWISIDNTKEFIYNGAVEAILTLLGAGVSLLAGKIQMNFLKKRNSTLTILIVMSGLQGLFAVLAATSHSLYACYVHYVCFGVAFAFGITICASEIAKNLEDDTFGLVFGFNTLVALILQTIVTLTVISNGFKLSPSGQYQVYGYSYFILSGFYFLMLFYEMIGKQIWRKTC